LIGIHFSGAFNGGEELMGWLIVGLFFWFEFLGLLFGGAYVFACLIDMTFGCFFGFWQMFLDGDDSEAQPRLK
jgi:hypothetical protein